MEENSIPINLLKEIVDRANIGVFVVDKDFNLVLWNSFMENYSQQKAPTVLGKNLFSSFPELPSPWLQQKIQNVFVLKNFSFTSWEHRPYLFKFLHNRPITGGIDHMRQNCTFLPLRGDSDEIDYVCITIFDVTDTSIYEGMLKSAIRSLAEASNRDALTNIYNRRFLEQTLSKEFSRIKRYGGTLSFIMIDLDHFKNINDTYGHLAGDEILKCAAQRIAKSLRTSDTLARYGGEEFAIILSETSLEGAKTFAGRLCANISRTPIIFNNIEINISASLGVSEYSENTNSHEELIDLADNALYFSKEKGRNRFTYYDNVSNKLIEGETIDEKTEQTDEITLNGSQTEADSSADTDAIEESALESQLHEFVISSSEQPNPEPSPPTTKSTNTKETNKEDSTNQQKTPDNQKLQVTIGRK